MCSSGEKLSLKISSRLPRSDWPQSSLSFILKPKLSFSLINYECYDQTKCSLCGVIHAFPNMDGFQIKVLSSFSVGFQRQDLMNDRKYKCEIQPTGVSFDCGHDFDDNLGIVDQTNPSMSTNTPISAVGAFVLIQLIPQALEVWPITP